ncbi:MAG: tRNA dihydrouridine synthase DusB [Rhodovibrionaceae bacterium]|nr:tRNA dihydrouridine synthase DusB [Rhodovibrionaceae bacterium]
MSIAIGPIVLDNPVILAPMSGVTDMPFRRLVKRFGAGLVVSEMIASQSMIRATRESMKMSTSCAEEFPMAVQLAGCEPEVMAEAARLNRDRGAAIIDINFGCPVKKVVNKQAGSALMREPALARRILEAVVKAVDLPVTLKMRLGWDSDNRNAPEFARIAEDCGIRMITVHGRTRCQLYQGRADWRAVGAVKQVTRLPVIVNGDIDGIEACMRALKLSGADGVMIGRGAYGRPWLPGQIAAHLVDGLRRADPDVAARHDIAVEHYEALLSHYGTEQGVRIARKHLGWYAHGLSGAAAFRQNVNRETDPGTVLRRLRELFASQEAQSLAA